MILRATVYGAPAASGIAVRGGAIAALDGEGGETLPDGAVILPGFTDSHVHLLTWASSLRELALAHTSLDAVLEQVREASGNGFVRGFGWAVEDDSESTRSRLDAVAPDTPVALLAHDYHSLWVNSAALALADAPLEVDGGVVERDADGQPTGMLREASAWAFRDRYVLPSRAEQIDALRAALPVLSSRGVTALHDKDGWIDCIGVVREPARPPTASCRCASGTRRRRTARTWKGADYVKAFMDGTLGSRTARMIGGGGVKVTSRGDFEEIVREAAARGLPVAVHAIGDQANRDALDAFEETRDAWAGLRPRIEHAQCVHPDDVPRFAALGVTASIQPAMAITDEPVAVKLWGDRLERAYAYGTLHRAGAGAGRRLRRAGRGVLDPFDGIRAAVLREWRPEERLTLDMALRAWTEVPAWLEGREETHGRPPPAARPTS